MAPPLFALVDVVFTAPIRVATPEGSGAGGAPAAPVAEIGVTNFVVSCAVFLMAFYANQHRITGSDGRIP